MYSTTTSQLTSPNSSPNREIKSDDWRSPLRPTAGALKIPRYITPNMFDDEGREKEQRVSKIAGRKLPRALFDESESSDFSQIKGQECLETGEKEATVQVAQKVIKTKSAPKAPVISYQTIKPLYGIDFSTPSEETNAQEFFGVGDQILEIEKILQTNQDLNVNAECVRQKVRNILWTEPFPIQMAELGAILFYLGRDQSIPEESALEFRAQEMCTEVEHYLKQHATLCDDPLIPSGKTHYLMRALAHMIFTPDQSYNKGGLYTIQQLLTNPKLQIAKYLEPEHRDHILVITCNLISKTSFDSLFKQQFTVHPTLEDAIRLDLKFNPRDPILSVHILYAAMMALFADNRQLNAPNCYAISAANYASENHTFKTLNFLLQILKRGYYDFNHILSIPVRALLDKRIICTSSDLGIELEADKALSLVTFEHISKTLSLAAKPDHGGMLPLGDTLSTILHANDATEVLPYAEKLYYAYKYNTLVHLQLAVLEFAYMNQNLPDYAHVQPYSNFKQNYIDLCYEGFSKALSRDLHPSEEFKRLMKKKIGERLWFENINQDSVRIEGRGLKGGVQDVPNFRGDLNDLNQLLQQSLRIFCLNKGQYALLKTINDLQDLILSIAIETNNEIMSEEGSYLPGKEIARAALSKSFKRSIAIYSSRQINLLGIEAGDLIDANLLIFAQTGGKGHSTLKLVYDINMNFSQVEGCKTPYQFLQKLSFQINKLKATHLKTAPKVMIVTPGDHAWTLAPYCWKILLENKSTFNGFIEKTIFGAANHKLKSPITLELVERIAKRYTSNLENQELILNDFQQEKGLTHSEFIEWFLNGTAISRKNEVLMYINEEYSKVSLSQQDLFDTLNFLEITVSHQALKEIYSQLNSNPRFVYHCANELRRLLIEESIAVLNPYDIELAIAKIKKMPASIYVGDLNWIRVKREDPFHTQLRIEYSWTDKTLGYFKIDDIGPLPQSNSYYSKYEINYPA